MSLSQTVRPQASPFLGIPLELREQIYRNALSTAPPDVNLLQTCRQINAEARPFLFKRTICFESQYKLHSWLGKRSNDDLRHVRSVGLRLEDADLSHLPDISSDRDEPPDRLLIEEEYESELTALSEALSKFPDIRCFTLVAEVGYQSHLYREFLYDFSRSLAGHCKQLHRLSLIGEHESIEFLGEMPSLRCFQWHGFTSDCQEEVTSALCALSNLTVLEISGDSSWAHSRRRTPANELKFRKPFTPGTLQQLAPLSSLTLHEQSFAGSGLFVNPEMLNALQVTHGSSLHTLKLSLCLPPRKDTLHALNTFLSSSNVRHLELGWPCMLADAVEIAYPATLRSLRLSVYSYAMAFDMLYGITRKKKELPHLHEIVLVANWLSLGPLLGTFKRTANWSDELDLAIRELRHLGVRTLKGEHSAS